MRTVKLLQVGDLHYPDLLSSRPNIDESDRGFPSILQYYVATAPSQSVAREMGRLVDRDKEIAGILICGDLTSKGDSDGFRAGLGWLSTQLRLYDRRKWPVESIHAVPGNHDVNRRAVKQGGTDIYKKFEDIESAWSAETADLRLTVRELRSTTVGQTSKLSLHSLNSCLGCGEYRGLPDAICDALWRATSELIETSNIEDYNRLQYEQLDTPAFDEAQITDLVHTIKSIPRGILPIVLAHHNILPQGLVRIAPYTEVVNGGNVRRRLSNCGRPVLYLHGHIHDDPIEDVTRLDGMNSHGTLITISAPELREGFNVLSIAFSQTGSPIGCAVEQYRRQQQGDVVKQSTVKIPLVRDAEKALPLLVEAGRAILTVLDGSLRRFQDVMTRIKGQFNLNRSVIEDRLREANRLKLAILINEDQEPDQWQIQGIRP